MSDCCKVYCSGSVKAPYKWITSTPIGINRLLLINGGEGGYIDNGKKIPFKKDALYLIPGNTNYIHTYSSYETDEQRLDHSYVNFELVPPILSKSVFCLHYEDNPELKCVVETFKALCIKSTVEKEFENLSENNQKLLKSLVIYLVDTILEQYNLKVVTDQLIINSLKLMHENLGKQQSIAQIAKSCYLSTDGFIRKFKNQIGETPYSYLKKLKIRTAQNMRSQGVSLEKIAEECGYADSSSLLHAIKKLNNFS